jgi:AGZA family xanthine/uracil permease-like MFS transporter
MLFISAPNIPKNAFFCFQIKILVVYHAMMNKIKKFFSLGNRSIKREFLAGLSTFATMVYVTAINPSILSDAGMDFGAVLVATILTTVLATALMGLLARFPIGVAPGMGVSTYFAYSLVQDGGHTWQQMLGLAAVVALLLLILNILDIRPE